MDSLIHWLIIQMDSPEPHPSSSNSQPSSATKRGSILHLPDMETVKDAVRKIASHENVHLFGGNNSSRSHVSFSGETEADSPRELLVENVETEPQDDENETTPAPTATMLHQARSMGVRSWTAAQQEEGIQCDLREVGETGRKARKSYTNFSYQGDVGLPLQFSFCNWRMLCVFLLHVWSDIYSKY